ncbi:heme-thiolate peroxidase [Fusarium decemcellulare]|uniref:Heme-thiolate peroxidase n=1 Tax=Fusarium decemcellulare TaxID=57161 RepID=A0ACC1S7E6_9HYPO|nr:heme-thiolate peroxidase [Fusarium decemcellulare]
MKLSTFWSLVVLCNHAVALPRLDPDTPIPLDAFKFNKAEGLDPHSAIDADMIRKYASQIPSVDKLVIDFNPKEQLIDVHGDHEFQPPNWEAGDVRGLCPGLNTLANHNYLPRNGVATWLQYVEAVGKVWGMSADLSSILATLGVVLGGDLPTFSFSQAGWSKHLNNNLGGLLGTPRGLDGAHPFFEVDGSPTRGDLYDPSGNNNDMNMTYFMELYNLQKGAKDPNYSIDVFFQHNKNRWYQTIATNPYAWFGPVSGWMTRGSPYAFASRLAANRSAEYPDEGRLDKATLKSFFSVYGPEDNMKYVVGHERIPENFYRRRYTDYGVAATFADVITHSSPEVLSIGGNTHGVNTFAGIDLHDLTGGAFNAESLLHGNNMLCYSLNGIKTITPNSMSSLFATLSPVVDLLLAAVEPVMGSFNCPVYKDLSVNGTSWFDFNHKTYPGFRKAGGGW